MLTIIRSRRSHHTTLLQPNYSKEEPDGLKIKVPDGTVLTVAQGGKSRSEAVSGDGVIYNMEPLKAGSFSFGDKTYKIVPEGRVRMIYTPSVWNVRDLGGWACTGGHIKYGKIFRGGHFGNITAANKTTLVDWLGIETDIDLRNNSETGSATTSPLGNGVEYFHQSLDYYASAVNTSDASTRTVAVLKKVMTCVAENKPCYFHCMSGADRTGTVAYLLLSLLGVSQSDKDKDYELTSFSDEADGRRMRNTNYTVTNGNGWYPLIKYFRDTYTGESDNEKVVAWAVNNGITTEEINAFRTAMISGYTGEVIVPPQQYTVMYALTGCTSSNNAATVTEGDAQILNKPSIPSKTSDLTNDSGFITSSDIPEGAAASNTVPKMDGTAAVGSELAFARGDHVHPSDTTKADKTELANYIPLSYKGANNGVAELDSTGKVPSSQLPSYVDDVIEGYYYNSKFYKESTHTTEITGEAGKIYVDISGSNKTYRWGGSESGFVEISESLALGETESTAFRGDYGKAAYTHAVTNKGLAFTSGLYKITTNSEGHVTNATAVTKSDITGLGIPDSNTKVTQAAAITTAGNYPVLLGYSTATTAVTNTVNKASSFTYNPSTGVLTATKVEATMDDGDLF